MVYEILRLVQDMNEEVLRLPLLLRPEILGVLSTNGASHEPTLLPEAVIEWRHGSGFGPSHSVQ